MIAQYDCNGHGHTLGLSTYLPSPWPQLVYPPQKPKQPRDEVLGILIRVVYLRFQSYLLLDVLEHNRQAGNQMSEGLLCYKERLVGV